MSPDPIRYSIVADYQAPWAKMHEFRAGGWVKWEDYARLKAEVERLTTGIPPEVSNDAVGRAVNVLLEKEKEIARLKADIKDLREDRIRMCDVTIEDIAVIARLKTEVESVRQVAQDNKTETEATRIENARLKAELDRVTSQNGYHHTGLAVGMLREELAHKCHDNLEIRKAHQATVQMVRDIQAEVERLRKAGDEIIHEWSSGHGTDVENFTKALWVWTVAKEGKQP